MGSSNPSILRVVAGIITHPATGDILIAKRQSFQHEGGKWEFPGGKLNPNETMFDALVRECQEEVGIYVEQAMICESVEKIDGQHTLQIEFWNVTHYEGEVLGCEGQEIRWVPVEDLRQYAFPGANQVVIEKLLR